MTYPECMSNVDIYADDWSPESLTDLFRQDSYGFEHFCADLFTAMGFQADVTQPVHDGGYDVVLRDEAGNTYLAECKCFDCRHTVGRPYLQCLVGAGLVKGVQGLICITTSRFSAEAVDYAEQAGVRLINGRDIISLMRLYMEF